MFWSSYYLALRCVFQLVSLRPRSEDFKELEIVVLRHELSVLRRQARRPQLTTTDRLFLAAASRLIPVGCVNSVSAANPRFLERGPSLRTPHVPAGVSGPHRDEMHYEFSNLLFWMKALQERLKTQVKDDGGVWRDIGLLPALAPNGPATVRVMELYCSLSQVFGERELANFATHAAAIPYPFKSSDYVDGKVTLRIPDRPTRRIYLWDEFTYDDKRDLRAFAQGVLRDVERLWRVCSMLSRRRIRKLGVSAV